MSGEGTDFLPNVYIIMAACSNARALERNKILEVPLSLFDLLTKIFVPISVRHNNADDKKRE